MMKTAAVFFVFLTVTAAAGCNSIPQVPDNPFEEIRTVAVTPFLNSANIDIDGIQAGEIFASELVKMKGMNVVRPKTLIEEVTANNLSVGTPEDLIKLAKRVKADAIITGIITEYNPYYPRKKVGMSIQMFSVKQNTRSSLQDIQQLVKSGKPFAIKDEAQLRNTILSFEKIFDCENSATYTELERYANSYTDSHAVHSGIDAFLRYTDKYLMFVSYQMINELVDMAHEQQAEEWRIKNKK